MLAAACTGAARAAQEPAAELDRAAAVLKAWAWCHAVERQIDTMVANVPELRMDLLALRTRWDAGPLAAGKRAIEEEMRNQLGEEAAQTRLTDADREMDAEVAAVKKIQSADETKAFIQETDCKRKGEVALPDTLGLLLSYCPEFRLNPEKEFTAGYVVPVKTVHDDVAIQLQWPMSWRAEKALNPAMTQKHVHHYGNGAMHGNLQILSRADASEVSDDDAFNAWGNSSDKAYFEGLGLTWHSSSAHVLRMATPPIDRTVKYKKGTAEGPLPGNRSVRVAVDSYRYFTEKRNVILFFNCLGPANSPKALELQSKYKFLFNMVANSIVVEKVGPVK